MRAGWLGLIGVSLLSMSAVGCQAADGLSSVERLEVELRVALDGTVVTRETFTLSVPDRGGTFSRHVPRERADALIFQSSSMDGHALEPGAPGAASLEIGGRDDLDMTWTFAPGPAAERVVSFSYRAEGAVAVRGTRGALRHEAVPASRPYAIRAARIRAGVPDDMHMFDGSGIAEAGWTVARTADGILAERGGVDAGAGATVVLELGIDPARIAEPTWQRHEEWARQLVPAFVSGGLFILVIGAGVLWIIRFQYPRRLAGQDVQERQVVRQGLRTTGVAGLGFAVLLAGVMWLTLRHLGPWSMAVPASVFIVGAVFLVVSRRLV
jgi:hypothetical protein